MDQLNSVPKATGLSKFAAPVTEASPDPSLWTPARTLDGTFDTTLAPLGSISSAASSSTPLPATSAALELLPVFPLGGASVFPGQKFNLRVFEKRYRLLMMQAMQQGTCLAFPVDGAGCTAAVRGCVGAGQQARLGAGGPLP